MPKYFSDIRDIEFNLFEQLKVQDHSRFGMGVDDYKGILEQYNKFVAEQIFPTREPSDVEGVSLEDGHVKAPKSLHSMHKSFYENGWFGLGLPEEDGGIPTPEAFFVSCNSLLTGANTAWGMYPGLTRAALNVLRLKGNDSQKARYVPGMMSGAMGGTMCLTEAGAGSDVGAARTTAKPLGDGTYAIEGIKIFISSGDNDLYDNIAHLVLARTPGAEEGTKGLSLFLVPKYHVGEDGSKGDFNHVVCTKVEHKMGIHASATCEISFGHNGEKCIGELIGDEFEGIATMFIMMNEARLYCGIQGEAQANLAYLMTREYATERSQFGQAIIDHPDVKRSLLRMRALSRGMRAISLFAAGLMDEEHENKQAADFVGLMTPICKAWCSERGFDVSVEAIQVHGGYGYCTEYGVEQFARDTKIATIYEGTNGIQAIDFTMRKVLKDQAKALTAMVEDIAKSTATYPSELAKEQALVQKVLQAGQGVLGALGQKAQSKDFPGVLQHATDFLNFCSNLIVAWRLGESAVLAHKSLDGASAEDKKYYESKVVDFRVFCSHFLGHNLAIAKTITDFEVDLSKVEI